jgi:hypothetical protein
MIDYNLISENSKVWIYQSNLELSEEISHIFEKAIEQFVEQWTSHNHTLKAWGKLFHNRFVVLMADESQSVASGCSIDKSVNFIRELQKISGTDFFDRFCFAYKNQDKIIAVNRVEFERMFKNSEITEDTLVFNNLVQTKKDFESGWLIPLGKSWHLNFVK